MRRRRALIPATLVGLALGGCTTVFPGSGEPALYGALDEGDVTLAAAAMQDGLENKRNDETVRWRNPQSGHGGAITPRVTLISDNGSFCRRYDEQLELADGRTTTLDNTACRDDAGRWVWLAE